MTSTTSAPPVEFRRVPDVKAAINGMIVPGGLKAGVPGLVGIGHRGDTYVIIRVDDNGRLCWRMSSLPRVGRDSSTWYHSMAEAMAGAQQREEMPQLPYEPDDPDDPYVP